MNPQIHIGHVRQHPIVRGAIYPTIYLDRSEFDLILNPLKSFFKYNHIAIRNTFNFQIMKYPTIQFVVIRDLRDTLISLYYSMKYSHPLLTEDYAQKRLRIECLDQEDALIGLIKNFMVRQAQIQMSWLQSHQDILTVRYEDLIRNEYDEFERIIDYCQISVSKKRLYEIVKGNSFENFTGRKRGEEDIHSHQRKGIAGDWRNHFTDRIKAIFKKAYGEVLIKTGYERDLNW